MAEQRAGTDDNALDAAMRDAVEAVESVEKKHAGKKKPTAEEESGEADDRAIEILDDDESDDEDDDEGESDDEAAEAARLRREVASLKDISIRTLADFDNYRKRVERERADLHRYSLLEPLRDFLPVIDNLERALSAGGGFEDLKLGVEMIHKQMLNLLKRFHVEPVAALDEPFDPTVHEAVSRVEEEEVEGPTVRHELQRGYRLHERLVRPAMVVVAMPPTAPSAAEPEATQDEDAAQGADAGGEAEAED